VAVSPSDLASTLMRRHSDALASAAGRAAELRHALEREVAAVISERIIRRAWLIGSLSGETHGPRSDVDLVVEGLAERDVSALWDRLSHSLRADVDLLRLEVLPDSFRSRVLAEGVPIDVT
jgi:predicted nucleotidyltransferase